MSSNSINTNVGAIVALQNLNVTSTALQTTQNQISTGLAVSGAKDNGAIWNIAQNSRASISSLDAVKQSLQRAQSTVDVAVSAGQTISDILNQIKAKSVAGSDNSLDTVSRKALNNDVQALIAQIQKIVSTADFNGANIIKHDLRAGERVRRLEADHSSGQSRRRQLGGRHFVYRDGVIHHCDDSRHVPVAGQHVHHRAQLGGREARHGVQRDHHTPELHLQSAGQPDAGRWKPRRR